MNNKNKDYKAMWSSHHFWIAVVAIAVLYIYPEIKKVNPTLAMIFAGNRIVAFSGFRFRHGCMHMESAAGRDRLAVIRQHEPLVFRLARLGFGPIAGENLFVF